MLANAYKCQQTLANIEIGHANTSICYQTQANAYKGKQKQADASKGTFFSEMWQHSRRIPVGNHCIVYRRPLLFEVDKLWQITANFQAENNRGALYGPKNRILG
jgi:hypothetical protein